MSVIDLNDQILGGVMQGMKAAGDRFADRMNEIAEMRGDKQKSEYFKEMAKALAKQVDDLTELLQRQDREMNEKHILLQKAEKRILDFSSQSIAHERYVELLRQRLIKVEDILQRQSAYSFSLEKFRDLALEELESIQNPEKSPLIDPVKQREIIEKEWNNFMKSTSVKQGLPKPGDKP